MKSEFRYPAYLVACGSVLFLGISIFIFTADLSQKSDPVLYFLHICPFIFVCIFIFFSELRTKTVAVIIKDNRIVVRRFAGVGIARTYEISDLSGFKTTILNAKSKEYEYLYLMTGNRKIAKLSGFYHSNYKELKRCLVVNGVKNIGVELYSTREQIKDIFSR